MKVITAVSLILLPVAFNAFFGVLAAIFDYPDVLRQPTGEILERFREGGTRLILVWWGFAVTAVLFGPVSVLVALQLDAPEGVRAISVVLGAMAATVQFLGLMRWPFLVPELARRHLVGGATEQLMIDVVFQSFNRVLGVAVGEHLGYMFTGLWTVSVAIGWHGVHTGTPWISVAGIVIGVALVGCSFEFVGSHEEKGWPIAARVTPIAYVAWSLWLVMLGVLILVR